jgi:hypothetical protein
MAIGTTRKFAFAAFALVLMAGMLFPALSVGQPTVTPSSVRPGETGVITVQITNALSSTSTTTTSTASVSTSSTSALENVQLYFAAAEGVALTAKSPILVGTIASGASIPVSIPFKVLSTAKGGSVGVPLYVSEKDSSALKTVVAVITISNPAILTLSSDRQTIASTESMNLTIKNNGGEARRLAIGMEDGSGFAFVGSTQIYVGDLANSTTIGVPIDSRKASEGVNAIPFVLTYYEEDGTSVSDAKSLSITVKKENADVAFTQLDPVVTAQDNVLRMKVANTGRQLDGFEVYLEDGNIQAKESKQVKLGDLANGESKEFSISVFAGAQPGVRNTEFLLRWTEDDVEKEEAVNVPIVVNSDADAAIFIDSKPAPIVPGGDYTLSVLVSNVGSYKIQNVEVSLPENGLFRVFNAQNSQYIGGLEADDFSTVQYKVRVGGVQPGTYPVNVLVRYKDQSGVWVDKNESIAISVLSAADAAPKNGNGGEFLLLVAVVVVAAVAYWHFRMRKPKHAAK